MNKLDVAETFFEVDDMYVRSDDHVQSPFRYPGGKYYALKFIIPMLNCIAHEEYREPFVGGGSVFFGKPLAQKNWINDLESDMIEIYKVIKDPDRVEVLVERVSGEVASRVRHTEIKSMSVNSDDDIAFKTFYLNRTSYSGIIHKPAWGYEIGQSAPPENWHKPLRNAHKKLRDVSITSLDFEDVIRAPTKKSVLLYLDPPYYLADQKRAYTKSFNETDHRRLEKLLKKTPHYFCLSYDDCPQIRELYKWANIYERTWFYNTANSKGPRKIGKELLITNYKVVHRGQLKLL
jgi:DNA adenine methylase